MSGLAFRTEDRARARVEGTSAHDRGQGSPVAHERTARLGAKRTLHAVTAGDGRDIVLIHGALATHQDWLDGPFMALAKIGRVTAIDRPGHGFSERARFAGDPRSHARQMRDGFEALGIERPVLVAHSFGCLSALAFAEQFPDQVAGLVLVAPLAFPEVRPLEHAVFAPRAVPILGPIGTPLFVTTSDPALLRVHHRVMFWPDAPPDQWQRNYPWELILNVSASVANGEDFAAVHPWNLESYVDLKSVTTTVEVLSGTADLVIEDLHHALGLAERLPHVRVERHVGVGHMLHHSRPEAVVGAVCRILN